MNIIRKNLSIIFYKKSNIVIFFIINFFIALINSLQSLDLFSQSTVEDQRNLYLFHISFYVFLGSLLVVSFFTSLFTQEIEKSSLKKKIIEQYSKYKMYIYQYISVLFFVVLYYVFQFSFLFCIKAFSIVNVLGFIFSNFIVSMVFISISLGVASFLKNIFTSFFALLLLYLVIFLMNFFSEYISNIYYAEFVSYFSIFKHLGDFFLGFFSLKSLIYIVSVFLFGIFIYTKKLLLYNLLIFTLLNILSFVVIKKDFFFLKNYKSSFSKEEKEKIQLFTEKVKYLEVVSNSVEQKKIYLFLKSVSKEFPDFSFKILSPKNDYEYLVDKELNVNDCYIPSSGKIFTCKTYTDIVINFLRSERVASFKGITFSENFQLMSDFISSLEEEGINVFRKNSFHEIIDEDFIILSTKNILSYRELENLKEALKNNKKSLLFIVENINLNEPMQKFIKFLEISLKKIKKVEIPSLEGQGIVSGKPFQLRSQIKIVAPLWNELIPNFMYLREENSRFFVVSSEDFLSNKIYSENIINIHKIFSWLIREDIFFQSFFHHSNIEKKYFNYTKPFVFLSHFFWLCFFGFMSFLFIFYRPFLKD